MNIFLAQNIKYLRKKKGLSQEHLAEKLAVNRSMIGSYEEDRAVPRIQVLQQMAHYFGVTLDEIVNIDLATMINKNGELKADITGKQLRVLSIVVDKNDNEMITVVPQKAAAGYTAGYSDAEYTESLPKLALELPELKRDRTYRAFQIKGDSMEPVPNGSYIICEYVQNWNDIKPGKSYIVLTTNDGIVFKRLFVNDDKSILLKSDNPAYEPYSILQSDLLELWRAVGYISLAMPETGEISLTKLAFTVDAMRREIELLKNK